MGHIGTELTITNHVGKPIKYAKVFVTPYNAVGDAVCCTVQGHSTMSIDIMGPLAEGNYWTGYCEDMWYNGSIVGANVEYATVEYMDGTKELFEAKDLLYMEGGNSNMVAITVSYSSRAGAPTTLIYTMDNGEKINLPQSNTFTHYFPPDTHTISVKNPFANKKYTFTAKDKMIIRVEGKGLKMNITEMG